MREWMLVAVVVAVLAALEIARIYRRAEPPSQSLSDCLLEHPGASVVDGECVWLD